LQIKRIVKRIGKIGLMLAGVLLLCGTPSALAGTNLLPNGSFEDYSCSALGCTWSDWSMPLGSGTVNTTDKTDGEVSLQVSSSSVNVTLDNEVSLSDDYYSAGTTFTITLHYQVLNLLQYDTVMLDCYWEPEAGGDADAMKRHEAALLQSALADTLSTGWETREIVTTKPAGSARLRIRVIVPKKAKMLFDGFRVEENINTDEPFIRLTPTRLPAVTAYYGDSAVFTTLHIEQGNLTGTTTFELSGYDPSMFHLSATSMEADETVKDLVITYVPTQAGSHSAILNIDNIQHTALFQSVNLQGTCIDTTLVPSITVTPDSLPAFNAVVGQDMRDTFTVVSTNCMDYVYLRVDHIQGAAFTIDGSMMGKNAKNDVQVRFAPTEAGEYLSTVTIYSEGVDAVVLTLRGTGVRRDSSNIDWLTHFQWDESQPMKLMNETFDNIGHNKTIVLDGWQNVAAVDERPWWGFDEAKTSPVRGDERYAKATAYQYAKDSTGTWEMFLVTPALDYKNSEGKIFAFSVMAEYLPDLGSETQLEIFYVDATGDKAYFQDLTESFVFPSISEENNIWRTYFLNLEPYAETMADVFHMAFRYIGPNGGAGAVTYYLDNVSWGRTDLPEIRVTPKYLIDSTAVIGKEKILGEIEVVGRNLTHNITVGLTGANYNRFNLSTGTLPIEGGTFTVSFLGQDQGVHEAYIFLSSKGAVDALIPLAVLCGGPMGIDTIEQTGIPIQKELRQGQIVIVRGDDIYSILGTKIQ